MANQPTTDSRSTQRNERHKQLYAQDPTIEHRVERRKWIGKEDKVNYLQRKYLEEFPELAEVDLFFLGCLGRLEVKGKIYLEDTHTGERITRDHYITEGHRWLINRFNPNTDLLEHLGLIQPPHIDGELRERIINRRYWDLTPSGRDLVDIQFSGEGVGDTGEHVVHRVGAHMMRWWLEEQHSDDGFWSSEVEMYPHVETGEYDLLELRSAGFQEIDGEDIDKHVYRAFEIETGVSDPTGGLEADALKMAYNPGDSWWLFPNREVLVKVLDELTLRGYTGLEYPVPETLAMREHRDTYNKRLGDATPENSNLPYSAVDWVMTYKHLAEDLKTWRPELFYGPRDQ